MTTGVRSGIGWIDQLDWLELLDLFYCALLDSNPCRIIMANFERLVAIREEIKANQEEMKARMDSNLEEMRAHQ
jgi:hypothetical protein